MQETGVQSLGWGDPQRRAWLPTPGCLPGEYHGQRSLVGCSPRVTKSQTQLKRLRMHTVCIYLAEWHFKILKCRQWEPKFFSKILFCLTSAWAQWALRTWALWHWAPTLCSLQLSSVAQLCLTLQPHGPQHTRPPCPLPTPRVCTNSCLLSRWYHPTISSSVVPFSSCPQSFPTSGSSQMSQLFTSGGQSIGVWASKSALPMNTQDWSLGWTGWISLQSKGLSTVFSNTTVEKHQFYIYIYIYIQMFRALCQKPEAWKCCILCETRPRKTLFWPTKKSAFSFI